MILGNPAPQGMTAPPKIRYDRLAMVFLPIFAGIGYGVYRLSSKKRRR